eukprot:g3573.t1
MDKDREESEAMYAFLRGHQKVSMDDQLLLEQLHTKSEELQTRKIPEALSFLRALRGKMLEELGGKIGKVEEEAQALLTELATGVPAGGTTGGENKAGPLAPTPGQTPPHQFLNPGALQIPDGPLAELRQLGDHRKKQVEEKFETFAEYSQLLNWKYRPQMFLSSERNSPNNLLAGLGGGLSSPRAMGADHMLGTTMNNVHRSLLDDIMLDDEDEDELLFAEDGSLLPNAHGSFVGGPLLAGSPSGVGAAALLGGGKSGIIAGGGGGDPFGGDQLHQAGGKGGSSPTAVGNKGIPTADVQILQVLRAEFDVRLRTWELAEAWLEKTHGWLSGIFAVTVLGNIEAVSNAIREAREAIRDIACTIGVENLEEELALTAKAKANSAAAKSKSVSVKSAVLSAAGPQAGTDEAHALKPVVLALAAEILTKWHDDYLVLLVGLAKFHATGHGNSSHNSKLWEAVFAELGTAGSPLQQLQTVSLSVLEGTHGIFAKKEKLLRICGEHEAAA